MLDAAVNPSVATHPQDTGQAADFAPTPSSRNWLVVHAYPQAERWANQELRRRGYTTYLPMMLVRRRDRAIRSLFHTVELPLFPRYLFCRYPGNWTPIRYCPGVYRLVSAAGKPNMAPDADISALQAAQAVRRDPVADTIQWAPGTPCCLAKGYAMGGMPAVVLANNGDEVRIGVMFLGQIRQVVVHPQSLVSRGEI